MSSHHLLQKEVRFCPVLQHFQFHRHWLKQLVYSLPELQNALESFKQYEIEQREKGEIIKNPIGALRKAIEEKWTPNYTKRMKERQEQESKDNLLKIVETNKKLANELRIQKETKFKPNRGLNICDACVWLKYDKGSHPLGYSEPDFNKHIWNYIFEATTP